MKNTNGSYVWHYIDNDDKVEGLKENHRYLVCVENSTEEKSEWIMITAYWYIKGAELRLWDPEGNPHNHMIKHTGFYVVQDVGRDRFDFIYQLHGVRYWTDIKLPDTNPEETLTIE